MYYRRRRSESQASLGWDILFTLSLFITLVLWNLFLLTNASNARSTLAQVIDQLAETDKLITSVYSELIAYARANPTTRVDIPNYPVKLSFSGTTLSQMSPERLKDAILEQSASGLYRGTSRLEQNAFQHRGSEWLFFQGMNLLLLGFTEQTHGLVNLLLLAFGGVTLFLLLALVSRHQFFHGLISLGRAFLLASLLPLLAVGGIDLWARSTAANQEDPLVKIWWTTLSWMAQVPERSLLVFLGLSLVLLLLGFLGRGLFGQPTYY